MLCYIKLNGAYLIDFIISSIFSYTLMSKVRWLDHKLFTPKFSKVDSLIITADMVSDTKVFGAS